MQLLESEFAAESNLRHGRALVTHVGAFIAGFLSTLVFHQGVLTLFWLSGALPRAPYDMAPAPPLGVPAVISLALWGGVWGVAIWPLLRKRRTTHESHEVIVVYPNNGDERVASAIVAGRGL